MNQDRDRSLTRQREPASAEKLFPDDAKIMLVLHFDETDMQKVRTWYKTTREELGDKFVADFKIPRLIFESFAGGAVNPKVVQCAFFDPLTETV